MTDSKTLSEALKKYGIAEQYNTQFDEKTLKLLADYCGMLWEWNDRMNLTRHTTWDKFVSRDLIDTLELSKLLEEGETVLDVGTGGGVPGVPLAIVRPDLTIGLAESVVKKARAVQGIVVELGLELTFFEGRAEAALQDYGFDTLFCRAVGPLWKILFWFEHQWESIGRILAIKGPSWVDERGVAREKGLLQDLNLRKISTYTMAGTESESVILGITPKARD
ncbi:MAG: 16S rRNA (guanine(527)-N(7))-methyltransferase RsmG [Pirellulaceae bacterium]|jgi:16S rRNA (guanine527-N7)-methyltransferase|nr:16S rRNA (guanine(527)-N(7))-methyltransferase RsmG [Mariniblastus sp.]MDB4756764.1 16S rRNA (guanine(527)-N(7))-methyltransferase RsmG [Mariniblastus sp.]MDG2469469.1 16S rRNA (guanine(527)-N(7))-methyltransferase RsmG [Pirellulaceae bacterium]